MPTPSIESGTSRLLGYVHSLVSEGRKPLGVALPPSSEAPDFYDHVKSLLSRETDGELMLRFLETQAHVISHDRHHREASQSLRGLMLLADVMQERFKANRLEHPPLAEIIKIAPELKRRISHHRTAPSEWAAPQKFEKWWYYQPFFEEALQGIFHHAPDVSLPSLEQTIISQIKNGGVAHEKTTVDS